MPRYRTLLSVIRLAFGGPANSSFWNWWPVLVFVVTGALSVFGTKLPKVHVSQAGWFLVLLAVSLVLALIAAYRLQREKEQRNAVSVSLEALHPGTVLSGITMGASGWSQGALVTNNGPGGRFRVHTVSHFQGLEVDGYGAGVALAWEQSETNEHHLSRGGKGNIKFFVSYVDQDGQKLRLWIPPSAYGAGFGVGTLLRVTGPVRFRLSVTDLDRDVSREFETEILFTGNDHHPRVTFVAVDA